MTRLHLDFETRSTVDLTKVGVYIYADHASTAIMLARYRIDAGDYGEWVPFHQQPMPDDLYFALHDPRVTIVAHNAGFERRMMAGAAGRALDLPELPASRFDCTAARAAAVGLPRSLDGAAAALNLMVAKDKDGAALMRRMMRPLPRTKRDPSLRWLDDAASIARLSQYCKVDVEVEHALDAVLPPLSPDEYETWRLTEEINDRGVLVDEDLLLATLFLVEAAEDDVRAELARLTNNSVENLHHSYVTKWLQSLGFDDLVEDGVGKAAVRALLERVDLDPLVRQVLVMRQEGGGTASKKFAAVARRMSADKRMRGSLVYCGATSTSRWCLAEGSPVMVKTSAGVILNRPIESILPDDQVWDGDAWVRHEGVVFSGEKDVITHDGVTATPNHIVYSSDTEYTFLGDAAARGVALYQGSGDPWST